MAQTNSTTSETGVNGFRIRVTTPKNTWFWGPFLNRAEAADYLKRLEITPSEGLDLTVEPARITHLPTCRIAVAGENVGASWEQRTITRQIHELSNPYGSLYKGIISVRGERIEVKKTSKTDWHVTRCLGPLYRWPAKLRPHMKAGDVDRAVEVLQQLFTPDELDTLLARLQGGAA